MSLRGLKPALLLCLEAASTDLVTTSITAPPGTRRGAPQTYGETRTRTGDTTIFSREEGFRVGPGGLTKGLEIAVIGGAPTQPTSCRFA